MAEIVNLFEIQIDTTAATKDMAASQRKVEALKDEIKQLKKAEGDNSEELAVLTANLKYQQTELRTNTRLTTAAITASNAQTGSLEEMRAQLAAVSIKWNRLSEEERANTEEGQLLTKQKKDLTSALSSEEQATGDARRNVGNYTESIQSAIGGLSSFVPGLGGASKAMSGFGGATTAALGPIGIIITVIGGVVAALKSFFESSEDGQNTLKKLQAVIDVVFGNLNDILSDVGEKLFDLFENPKKSIAEFWELLKENVVNRFTGLLKLVPRLGEAIGKLFKGDFKGAAKVAGDAVLQVTTGIEDFSDKAVAFIGKAKDAMTELAIETEKEIKIAQRLADQQANLEKQIRKTSIANAKAQNEVAEIRAKTADKENTTSEERLLLLDQAITKEEEILQRNVDIAAQKLKIKQVQNSLSKSTKEDLEEETRLEVELINVRTQAANATRKLQTERQTALKEFNTEQEELEIAELEAKIDREDALFAKEVEMATKRNELKAAEFAQLQEAIALNEQNKQALQQSSIFAELENERAGLEMKRLQEVEFAEKIGADVNLINQKYQEATMALNQAEFNAKMSLAQDFASNVATIAGESTAVGKAAAVAAATMNTYQAATGAYASLAPIPIVGPVLGIAAAGAAVASGLANVKKILAVSASGGSSSGSSSGGSTTSVRSTATSDVNSGIVSRSANTATESETSVQPTLVVDSVTSKQSSESANNKTAAS